MKSKSIKKIITFLIITLVLSLCFYIPIIQSGSLETNGGILVLGLMWCPGISGIITQLIFEHTLRGMGWKLGKFKYLLLAYLIPLGYCLVVYGITWISGLGKVPNPDFISAVNQSVGLGGVPQGIKTAIYLVVAGITGLIPGILSGAGEEIGWRGLFVPELAKVTSFTKTTFISGLVWTVWHMPLILFANYNMPGTPKWYALVMFTIMVLGINVIFSWLRLKSGSLWSAAMLHASHNLFVQSIFTPMTLQTKVTPYIIDEFGIGLALVGIILAIVFLRKAKELNPA